MRALRIPVAWFVYFAVAVFSLSPGVGNSFPLRKPSVIRIPGDYPLISLGVDAARDGDVIEVDDGFYFEKNIVLDRAVTLRSRNLFGAVICGSDENGAAIFIIRASCIIEGFILKNSHVGLLQRDSPDVEWTGRNLALFQMDEGITIDDRGERRGSARLSDIIADKCDVAFRTNDARRMEISRALVTNATAAFSGANHEAFVVRDIVAWNCRELTNEHGGADLPPSPADRVEIGPRVSSFDSGGKTSKGATLQQQLNALSAPPGDQPAFSSEQSRRREALFLMIAGDIFRQNGNPQLAAAHYKTALESTAGIPRGEVAWRAVLGLALAAEARGDEIGMIAFLKKTVAIVEEIGAILPIQALQIGFRGDRVGIYEDLIGHLVDLHHKNPLGGYDREALWYAEKSRARGFMVGSRVSSTIGSPEMVSRVGELNRDVTRLQIEFQNPDLSVRQRDELLADLDKAEINRSAYILNSRRNDLETGRYQFPTTCGLDEIRTKLLRPGTGLLEYVLGEEKSFAFLLTADGLETAVLPSSGALRPMIAGYLKFLNLRESDKFRGREGGLALAGILLDPFRDRLASGLKKLLVIPDGTLHYLPFETLLRTVDGREKFLVEDFEIIYGPSASGLIHISERPTPSSYPMDFLGLANPNSLRIFAFSEREFILFPNLPFSTREIRTIRNFFRRDRTMLLEGKEAREDRFKALRLSDFKVIHIAAHGYFDDRNWHRSALLLLPDGTGKEDGFVQANEIYPLLIQPELLVLSGCQTGLGHLEKGGGLTGLSSAFFFTGARSILLSLWNVNDKAASVFMESFYRYFTGGMEKAEALRRAKLEMLNSRYRHPFYWAAFVLQGN